MKAVLKAANKVLINSGKIFQVGEARPPVLAIDHTTLSGFLDGQPLVKWLDSSGTNNDAYQDVAANQAVVRTNRLNGLPVVEFRRAGQQYLKLDVGIPVRNATVMMLFRLPATSTEPGIYFGFDPAARFATPYKGYFVGSQTLFFQENSSEKLVSTFSKAYRNSAYVTYAQLTTNTSWALLTLDVVLPTDFIVNRIGYGWDDYWGNPTLNADVAAMYFYNYRLPEIDRKAKEGQILATYGL